jgi:hypothetical protein
MKNNIVFENIMNYNAWLFLQWYYMPYMLIGKGDDVDQWIKAVSLNGIKLHSPNICKPN